MYMHLGSTIDQTIDVDCGRRTALPPLLFAPTITDTTLNYFTNEKMSVSPFIKFYQLQ